MSDIKSVLIEKLPSQHLFLFWRDLCESTNVYSAIKIMLPGLQQHDFERAFEYLLASHFELNSYFDNVDQNYSDFVYKLDLAPKTLNNFIYRDLRNSGDTEYQIEELKKNILRKVFDIRSLNSYLLNVIRIDGDKYFILFCSEHMLLDGLGVDFILTEYLKALQPSKLLADATSTDLLHALDEYNNTIRLYNSHDIKDLKSNDFYLKYMEKTNTSRFFWAPEGKSLTNLKGKYSSINLTLNDTIFSKVRGLSNEYNASLYTCLLYIFCLALYRVDKNLTQSIIQIPTHGKAIDKQVVPINMAGCFAQAFVMPIDRKITEQTPLDAIDYIKTHSEKCQFFQIDQINARATASSLSANKTLKSKLQEESFALLVRKNMQTNIYFSFFGNSAIDSEKLPYDILGYDFGTTNLGGALDVMAISVNGSINFSFNYDSIYFTQDFITKLINIFIETISSIDPFISNEGVTVTDNYEGELSWVIELINKFSIEVVTLQDRGCLLEIDLGIDSLAKTRLIAELENVASAKGFQFERKEIFSAQTVSDILSALIKQDN